MLNFKIINETYSKNINSLSVLGTLNLKHRRPFMGLGNLAPGATAH